MCDSFILKALAGAGGIGLFWLMIYILLKLIDLVEDYVRNKENLGYARRDLAELHKRLSNVEYKEVVNLHSRLDVAELYLKQLREVKKPTK